MAEPRSIRERERQLASRAKAEEAARQKPMQQNKRDDFKVVRRQSAPQPSAVERQVKNIFGMEPNLQRGTLLPFAKNPRTGKPEFAAPQVLYDLARAFVAPGVVLSGQPVDLEDEAQNLALSFTGTGAASRVGRLGREALAVDRNVVGMSGGAPRRIAVEKAAERTAAKERPLAAKPTSSNSAATAPAKPKTEKPPAAKPARDLAVRRVHPARVAMDPRIEKRAGERPKVEAMEIELAPRATGEAPVLSVFDLEGKPFITSMSDLSAAGDDITAINDVVLPEPVSRRGGQDYMFDNPGSVWAADLGSAGRHLELARRMKTETGQDPLYLPWAMGPTAIDFAHMPRELMLRYASANMGKRAGQRLNKDVRAIVPEFKSVEDPGSMEAFREATGSQRAELNRLLDKQRDAGGLGIGAARLATTDLDQIGVPLTSLRNVGVIDAGAALSPSTHPSYRTSIPGEGIGRLQEPIGALELLPDIMTDAGLTDPFGFPVGVVKGVKSPMRALQMGPKGGIITEDLLRAIERRLAARKENR